MYELQFANFSGRNKKIGETILLMLQITFCARCNDVTLKTFYLNSLIQYLKTKSI